MSAIPTSPQDVLQNAWFIEEVTEGVPVVNGTWKNIGVNATLNEGSEHESEEIPIEGDEDYFNDVKLRSMKNFDMRYYILNSTEFLRYLTEKRNATGTIAKSLSILQKQLIDGATKWKLYTGVRPGSGTLNIERIISCDIALRAIDYTDWIDTTTLQGLIGTSYVPPGALTGTVWTNLTGGTTTPFTIGGTPYKLNRLTVGINRNLRDLQPLGNENPTNIGAGNRRISVSLETWNFGNSIYTFHKNYTPQTLIMRLRGGAFGSNVDLTLGEAVFPGYSRPLDASSNDYQTEALTGKARTVTLTAVSS